MQSYTHLSDFYLTETASQKEWPQEGVKRPLAWTQEDLNSGSSFFTKQLSGLAVSREAGRGTVVGFPDMGSALSSTSIFLQFPLTL